MIDIRKFTSTISDPVYILRSALYKTISQEAQFMQGNILDFGCGTKPYKSLFTIAKSYVGLEIQSSGNKRPDSVVDFFYNGKKFPFKTKVSMLFYHY
ncbi:hypothetical protein [Candidatus Methylopumilus planktonicus]|uniref:hypothetical protein n=1 Tax=Candidatus Methylopumilus planktonicus TaxID=1581557 RepID=UPI003D18E6F1